MALFDMIKDTLKDDELDPSFESVIDRSSTMETHTALESMGGIGQPKVPAEPNYQIFTPDQFLHAFESEQALKHGELTDDPIMQIAAGLEENLPDEDPSYDPTEDLEDVINVLSGIDADDGVDPDQPNPEDELSTDDSIMRNMTTPKDTTSAGGDVRSDENELDD